MAIDEEHRVEIDRLADEFENKYRAGIPLRIEDLLAQNPHLSPELLRELLEVEAELRRRDGEQPAADEYRARFPENSDIIHDVLSQDETIALPSTPEEERGEKPPSRRSADHNIESGQQIGPYKLRQRLGEGGMGAVYMAEQKRPVKRMVAIKIIKAGMDSEQVVARFEAERQALAMMDHPNIAKVFDAGTTDSGQPYFVMELVKGVSITKYCDDHKLSPVERLGLFVDVCQAVQHAHQRGIIHRDVKPSNVMVSLHDGEPVVKVIDFGLAKATVQKLTERTLFTQFGQMVGTPTYMSPEQAEMSGLDIDTRTDVYSLGVLLYELMTGTTPIRMESLRAAGYAKIQQMIRELEAEPMKSRLISLGDSSTEVASQRSCDRIQLTELLSGDLNIIALKSLEKDRNRRYESPRDFARDVQRFLKHEPIEARPASVAYRARKFYQRNRATAISSAVVVSVLIFTALIATSVVVVSRRQNQEQIARAEATNELNRLETAIDAVSTARGILVPYVIEDLKEYPNESVTGRLKRRFEKSDNVQKLPLAYALAHYNDVRVDLLVAASQHASTDEVDNLVTALSRSRIDALAALKRFASEAHAEKNWKYKARLALLALYLDSQTLAQEVCKTAPNPTQRTWFIEECAKWHGDLTALKNVVSAIEETAIRSAILLAVGMTPAEDVVPRDKLAWEPELVSWYTTAPDAVTHSAARWVLQKWKLDLPELSPSAAPSGGMEWHVNGVGMTLVRISAGSFMRPIEQRGDGNRLLGVWNQQVEISRPFLLADCEVTQPQFQLFMDESDEKIKAWLGSDPETSPSSEHPVTNMNWRYAVVFCNWLSQREGLTPCYIDVKTRDLTDDWESFHPPGKPKTKRMYKLVDSGSTVREMDVPQFEGYEKDHAAWRLLPHADGYRLPTEAEWEYACRAGTTTMFSHGDEPSLLERYAVYRSDTVQVPYSRLPNGWGLSDMHGNVNEFCYDQFYGFPRDNSVKDPLGNRVSTEGYRTYRGGSHASVFADRLRSDSRYRCRNNLSNGKHDGFRVARSLIPAP